MKNCNVPLVPPSTVAATECSGGWRLSMQKAAVHSGIIEVPLWGSLTLKFCALL